MSGSQGPRYPRPDGSSATRMETVDQQREAEEALPTLFKRIDELAGLDDRAYFELENRSTLALDDRAIYPHQVSAAPRLAILSTIDHLRTIADIVREAETMPMTAIATVLRSAIETSCSAIYLLTPNDRRERVLRALRDVYFQIEDRENMVGDLAPGSSIDRSAHEQAVRDALAGFPEAGTWNDITGGRAVSITQKITVACPIVEAHKQRGRADFAIRGLWRGFSGLTHGRAYAAQAILDREELGYDEETGVVSAHLTFGARSLLGTLRVALDVVETAVHLYGVRARTFTALPEDAAFVGRLRTESRL